MLATDLFIMGFLWQAAKLDESLSEEDILMLLDAEDAIDEEDELSIDQEPGDNQFTIEPDEAAMDFIELMDYTCSRGD
jgi:hypothetical protein